VTLLAYVNFLVVVIVVVGVLSRRKRRIHIPLMVVALGIDLAMVLYLELTRAVVETLPDREMAPLLVVHIAISVLVLVLYGVQVATGIRNARGQRSKAHRKVMIWFLLLRLGNAITSVLIMS
jgi:hypothetical protein